MEGSVQSITIGGVEYVVVPRTEYERLTGERAAWGATDAIEAGRRMLGEDLRKAREQAGLTQAELAGRLKKSQPMVSGAESGRVRVGPAYVKAVLRACGLPPDWSPAKGPSAKAPPKSRAARPPAIPSRKPTKAPSATKTRAQPAKAAR